MMSRNRSSRDRALRALAPIVLAAAAAPVLAQTNPYLVSFDLRVDGTNAKQAIVHQVGDSVTLDLYAHVYGTNGNLTDDAIQDAYGSFTSSKGGLLGDLLSLTPVAPFDANAVAGQSKDLDGDGDLDVGQLGMLSGSSQYWFFAHSLGRTYSDPNADLMIAQVRFTVSALSGTSTDINFIHGLFQTYRVWGPLIFPDDATPGIILPGNDPRIQYGAPVTISAESAGSDPVQYLDGTINTHLTVSGNVKPTPGGTLTIATGLDITPTGTFDTRDSGGSYGSHQINIQDATSGNAGGILVSGSMNVRTGTFTSSAGYTHIANSLIVGNSAADTANFNVTGGSVDLGAVTIANAGVGNFSQSGGTASISSLTTAITAGSSASINVSGGTFLVSGTASIGGAGAASLHQTGGTVSFNSSLSTVAANGQIVIDQGSFNTDIITVTAGASGGIVQNGGDVHSTQVRLNSTSAPSTYSLNNGTINAQAILVGQTGSGDFIQNGGDANVASSLQVATTGSSATYHLNSGNLNSLITLVAYGTSINPQNYSGTGAFIQSGGTHQVGSLKIGKNGSYTVAGGMLKITKNLQNYGTIDFTNAAGNFVAAANSFADFSQGQIANASNATFTGEAGSLMNFAPGFDPLVSVGHLSTDGLVHINGQPLLIPQANSLHGSGTIEGDVTNNGTVSPGNSPGEIDIVGNLTHAANANVLIELAGNTSDNFDQITVTGAASLQGSLSVALLDDYLPAKTDSFTFLTAGSIQGKFANALTGIDFPSGHFDVSYSPTTVTLSNFTAVPEPTSIALLSLAAPALLRRRKRAMSSAH